MKDPRALPEHVRRAIALGQGVPRETPVGRMKEALRPLREVGLVNSGLILQDVGSAIRPRGRSKLQARYADELKLRLRAGELVDVVEEGISLRLADRTWFRPDFLIRFADGRLEVHEVKGHWEDDARAKLKIAGELHPWAAFVAVRRGARGRGTDPGGWEFERIPGPRSRR